MKILKTKYVLPVAVLILFFAVNIACSKDSNNNNTSGLSTQDQTFVTNASASNAAEIQFGQLAEQKSVNDSVKVFARVMITDQQRTESLICTIFPEHLLSACVYVSGIFLFSIKGKADLF